MTTAMFCLFMTRLAAANFKCHNDHEYVLFVVIIIRVCNKSTTMDDTSGTGATYSSRLHSRLFGARGVQSIAFCISLIVFSFYLLVIVLAVLLPLKILIISLISSTFSFGHYISCPSSIKDLIISLISSTFSYIAFLSLIKNELF